METCPFLANILGCLDCRRTHLQLPKPAVYNIHSSGVGPQVIAENIKNGGDLNAMVPGQKVGQQSCSTMSRMTHQTHTIHTLMVLVQVQLDSLRCLLVHSPGVRHFWLL